MQYCPDGLANCDGMNIGFFCMDRTEMKYPMYEKPMDATANYAMVAARVFGIAATEVAKHC
jgi:hypothetical protein